ncbi:MAG: RDD family protein [Cyanobacteria bacterium]|nr:RDD family protein [Cyanobacteriota bacterium]
MNHHQHPSDIRALYFLEAFDQSPLEFELAGIGRRMLAGCIDLFLISVFIVVIFIALFALEQVSPELAGTIANLFYAKELLKYPAFGWILVIFLGSSFFGFFYHLTLEWLWQGQTIGKYCASIRVIREDGHAIGFWESFGRNILRYFMDVFPLGIGLYPLILSSQEKRLGDYLAGTLVISTHDVSKVLISADEMAIELEQIQAISQASNPRKTHLFEKQNFGFRAYGLVSPEEFEILRDYLKRQKHFAATTRIHLCEMLEHYFKEKLRLPALPNRHEITLKNRLIQLHQDYLINTLLEKA